MRQAEQAHALSAPAVPAAPGPLTAPQAQSAPCHLPALPQRLYTLGFTPWKQPTLRLCFPQHELRPIETPAQLPSGAAVLVWGPGPQALAQHGGPVLRVEDGFLRSVGLGADLVRPLSWVIDARGLHFDARRASDLEHLLAQDVPAETLQQAARLREAIVSARLTKYNVGQGRWRAPAGARRIVLVPGQVESDASLALGAPGLRGNIALLKAARAAEPDAHLVYKVHPDVAARLRAAGAGEAEAQRWADEVVVDAPMADLLDAADTVHVMTSLSGFEALLRGKRVVCHGLPFYAGWGLTQDRLPLPRRTRRLTLDALVAGALLRYPLYFSRDGARRLTPLEALDELLRWRDEAGAALPWWRLARREVQRVVLRHTVGVR